MKASEAKQAAKTYYNKLVSDHAVEYKKMMERERKETEAVWAKRGDALVALLEGYIKKASTNGQHNIWEPTDVNVHGDDVFYLEEADKPIYKKLMNHFRENGFTVAEYQYMGMKITW